jgi:hypothetical protein
MSRSYPDAREVDRVDGLMTVDDSARADEFLARCVPGTNWTARIRTARIRAGVVSRGPLGTFDERVCSCVRLRLALPIPVEPGLRFQIVADDDESLSATGVVRPWDG